MIPHDDWMMFTLNSSEVRSDVRAKLLDLLDEVTFGAMGNLG